MAPLGLLLLALAAGGYLFWIVETRLPVRAADAPPQAFLVPPGTSAEAIARQLQGMGLVRHPAIFRALALARGAGGKLRAGEYSLEGPLSLEQILEILSKGEVVRHSVTFPEGKSVAEMAEIAAGHRLSVEEFLAAARESALVREIDPEATDLEGYLFPDTYDLPSGPAPARTLVGRMVQRCREVLAPGLPTIEARGLTVRQWVTLASLVELETARGEERPRIAAVFLNRLQKGMLLQTDPTVIYALRRAGTYDGNIRKRDLDIDSPYNTYRKAGLPPGPIASPGKEALRAVLEPADAKDLYFVSRNDGTHQFSESLAEHERAVDRYQRQRGARGKASS